MAYQVPQLTVFAQARQVPQAATNTRKAFLVGPHAALLRYDVAAERPSGLLGYYDSVVDQTYTFPNRPAGGIIDSTYTKVVVENALLRYFDDQAGSGFAITKQVGFNNRITTAALNFKSNTAAARNNVFLDRDVQIGDIVKVRGIVSGQPETLWTSVAGLVPNVVASSVAAATAASSNPGSQSATLTVTQTAGPVNCVVPTGVATAYDSLPSGFINETYEITVVTGSTGGLLNTARLRVRSASGTDDVDNVIPALVGSPFAIGTRGLTFNFDATTGAPCLASASSAGVSAVDLIPGQKWTAVVADAFTPSVATSSGTFDSDVSLTYLVTVSKGGIWAGLPQIVVTDASGRDTSGPTTVTAAATPVAVGTKGVLVAFSGTGLRKGDQYIIAATGRTEGPVRTIVLANNLNSAMVSGSEVDLSLYILKPKLAVEKNRIGSAPLTNWSQTGTTLTVGSGLQAKDPTWTSAGTQVALPVHSEPSKSYGKVYVEYRAWLSSLTTSITTVTAATLDTQIPGVLHPDNPLKWGAAEALGSSNGVDIRVVAVSDPAVLQAWTNALSLSTSRKDTYGFVPLTDDPNVQSLFIAHVNTFSTEDRGQWRTTWLSLPSFPRVPIVHAGSTVVNHTSATTSDSNAALCVIEDDPGISGTQCIRLRNTSGNALFVTNGVRPGDKVRYLYSTDGFGTELYTEFVVDLVESEDQIRLLAGPVGPAVVPARTEIWRELTSAEEAAEIGGVVTARNSYRVRSLWPDTIVTTSGVQRGHFVAAKLAGIASGVLPQQGLTNLELSSYLSVPRTNGRFTESDLDIMATAGAFIVTQDAATGVVYPRHALTSIQDPTSPYREEAFVRNLDSILYAFRDKFRPFVGQTNITPSNLQALRLEAQTLLAQLLTETFTVNLGGQIISGNILSITQNAVLLDQVDVEIELELPRVLNRLRIKLLV